MCLSYTTVHLILQGVCTISYAKVDTPSHTPTQKGASYMEVYLMQNASQTPIIPSQVYIII